MCGLAGVARRAPRGVSTGMLRRMIDAIRHRGPDDSGIYADDRVGLAHARLSVIDPPGGAQPMATASGDLHIVYNGEVFNFQTLRSDLEARGHRFRTRSDTEVLLRGYAAWGEGMVDRLNGQFAFAIYDRRAQSVFLARDRFGIAPLFYAVSGGDLYFASETKALLASGEVEASLDPTGLDQVFTFMAARPPRTPLRGVSALEPGCCALWRDGRLSKRRYYALDYPEAGAETENAVERLDELLRSAVSLRLLADVPVGAYLSGGLDSSVVAALASAHAADALRTFSVAFDDPQFDESAHQDAVARHVGSRHVVRRIRTADIARVFPDVIWHAETPVLRTAPAPLYLLSQLTREQGIKVVLAGEGADELFAGYDLFKDTTVRLFCLRQPDSASRPRLFERLYPYVGARERRGEFWARYFLSAGSPADPLFSHLPRFRLTGWIKHFYTAEFRASLEGTDPLADLRDELPAAFMRWSPLARATYLEIVTLLSPYLLAAQGDRMAMAHGVEARVPYLDHRVFEFAARLPTRSKLRGLRDKDILRRWATRLLPSAVASRPKQPYRAPDVAPEQVMHLLDAASLERTGIFDPRAVAGLLRRCRRAPAFSEREAQALVAILSTQIWHAQFLRSPATVGTRHRQSVA